MAFVVVLATQTMQMPTSAAAGGSIAFGELDADNRILATTVTWDSWDPGPEGACGLLLQVRSDNYENPAVPDEVFLPHNGQATGALRVDVRLKSTMPGTYAFSLLARCVTWSEDGGISTDPTDNLLATNTYTIASRYVYKTTSLWPDAVGFANGHEGIPASRVAVTYEHRPHLSLTLEVRDATGSLIGSDTSTDSRAELAVELGAPVTVDSLEAALLENGQVIDSWRIGVHRRWSPWSLNPLSGQPYTFKPCSTITWHYDNSEEPAGHSDTAAEIKNAFDIVSRTTGLVFTQVNDPASAQILTGWYGLAADGGGMPDSTDGGFYATGAMVLSTASGIALSPISEDPDRAAVILHQLGHVVGLGDVNDGVSLMTYSYVPGRTSQGFTRSEQSALNALYQSSSCPSWSPSAQPAPDPLGDYLTAPPTKLRAKFVHGGRDLVARFEPSVARKGLVKYTLSIQTDYIPSTDTVVFTNVKSRKGKGIRRIVWKNVPPKHTLEVVLRVSAVYASKVNDPSPSILVCYDGC